MLLSTERKSNLVTTVFMSAGSTGFKRDIEICDMREVIKDGLHGIFEVHNSGYLRSSEYVTLAVFSLIDFF